MPQRFTYLLNKIDDKKDQEWAVRNGVSALFDANRTECLDPLLIALNEGTFLSKDLENVAIRGAFETASNYQDDRALFAKRFFDHPAISAEDYSDALYRSYHHGGQD